MYFSNEQVYGQDAYPFLMPFPTHDFSYMALGDRQFLPGPPSSLPPFAPPGQGMQGGAPFSPPGQGMQAGPPSSPPPAMVPTQTQQAAAFAVDPGSIRRCLFRFTYVWLRGYQQFWFYPTFVGRRSVSGYRWNGFRWLYFGISLRQIQSFTCV
ncbi:MAG: hypothetical protein AB2392_18260 [Neobacillus sp.]